VDRVRQQIRPEAADALAAPGWGPIVSALDGAGHNIHSENFIDFIDAVAAFLRSIWGQAFGTADIEVSRDIAASPEAVFAAITDITRMGEWSPETRRAEWNEGFDRAEVGAQYTGHNQNGDKEWSIMATIVELMPCERFFFDCSSRDFVFAKWGYAIEPTATGCRVTEYAQDLRPEASKARGESISGVADRVTHNRAGMEATLERLAAALES
jgi:uncharacterized protein YndB with AHSA1/START domain